MANVVLSDGKKVEISPVIFNKEQKINVPKTYITTVKKSVTRVSEKFYKVENKPEVDLDKTVVFETLPENEIAKDQASNIESALEMAMPELNFDHPVEKVENNNQSIENATDNLDVTPVVKEKEPETVINPISQVEKNNEEINSNTAPIASQPELETKEVEPEVVIPKIITPTVEEIKNPEETPAEEIKSDELKEAMNIAATEQVEEIKEPTPLFETPVLPIQEKDETEIQPMVTEAPTIEPITPVVAEPTIQPEPKLFFDGTNESNLNKALGEVSEEKVVSAPQDGVQSLREFGTEEAVLAQTDQMPVEQNVKTLTRSKGFANNKFFMVIAIVFFLAACVFLGYEAFQYFQLKG